MQIETRSRSSRAHLSGSLLTSIAAFMFLAVPAHAANVTVGCPGGSGTYPSINAALAAIGVIGPSTITVTGTCNENVTLVDASAITIVAPVPGGAGSGGATIIGPQDTDVFDISNSLDINLLNLEIRGNAASSFGGGVSMSPSSVASIAHCNIHDNKDFGVSVDSGSQVFLRHTMIQNNSPGDGLDVTTDSSADVFFATIQNNGLPVTGGVGVFVQNRSGVIFRQQNSILNNGDVGVFAADLCRVNFQTGVPAFFTTIQGHGVNGIQVAAQSIVRLGGGQHVIQNNGSSCPADPTCGGIFGFRNSTVRLATGNVSGNQGSGIDVEQGTDLALLNTTISNNSGDGVHLQRISIGEFDTPNTISGNGGASVFCDSNSLAEGDLSTFSKIECKNIERTNGKVHAGKAKEPNP